MQIDLNENKLEINAGCHYIKFRADKNLAETIIYLPEKKMEYIIPTGERLDVYPKGSFEGPDYTYSCVEATSEEIVKYRNLALNPADRRGETNYFPHSDANYVTRDSIWFESRNAIDGFVGPCGHHGFPHQSWGGGDRDDLEYFLYFGRPVLVDKLVLHLRADYNVSNDKEHDTYWKSIKVEFSDGSEIAISPVKTADGQVFTFEPKTISSLKLTNLVRDWSFPTMGYAALSQIEVWGKDIIE